MNTLIGFSLLFCAAATGVLMGSFSKTVLQRRRSAVFFGMLIMALLIFLAGAAGWLAADKISGGMVKMTQLLVFLGLFSLTHLYTLYLKSIIEEAEPVAAVIPVLSAVICTVGFFCWAMLVLQGGFAEGVVYRRPGNPWYVVGQLSGVFVCLINLQMMIRHYRIIGIGFIIILSSLIWVPSLALLAEYLFGTRSLRLQSLFFPLLLIFIRYHLEMVEKLQQKEVELLKSQIGLMTGRMRPHYLYNVLSTIYYLCDKDSQQAKEAISVFSDYLRDTLEAMQKQELVPLTWERQAIRNYIILENMRYSHRLHVEARSEVDEERIKIPPLSVQPLVENAIRHGIMKRKEGGTIYVQADTRPDGSVRIVVRDNGVGFDPRSTKEGEGIRNVRERLQMQCKGELSIESTPGKGTRAEILLPPPEETGASG